MFHCLLAIYAPLFLLFNCFQSNSAATRHEPISTLTVEWQGVHVGQHAEDLTGFLLDYRANDDLQWTQYGKLIPYHAENGRYRVQIAGIEGCQLYWVKVKLKDKFNEIVFESPPIQATTDDYGKLFCTQKGPQNVSFPLDMRWMSSKRIWYDRSLDEPVTTHDARLLRLPQPSDRQSHSLYLMATLHRNGSVSFTAEQSHVFNGIVICIAEVVVCPPNSKQIGSNCFWVIPTAGTKLDSVRYLCHPYRLLHNPRNLLAHALEIFELAKKGLSLARKD